MLPQRLLRGLLPLDDPVRVERYREALAAIGAAGTKLSHFHVDAGGYSPEIAEELSDPLYLGRDPLHAHAILVTAAQLDAPLVHPALGFARDALRALGSKARRSISTITLREPLLAEAKPSSGHVRAALELADTAHFELGVRTPAGSVQGTLRLEAMKREFLESDRLWLDDAYIAEMAALAARVRDVGGFPEELVSSRHRLGRSPYYVPAFGGAYVVAERSRRAAGTTILCAEQGVCLLQGEVELRSLEPESVLEVLRRYDVARIDLRALRSDPGELEANQHWVALEHLLGRRSPDEKDALGPAEVAALMRAESDPPREYLELRELRLAVDVGRGESAVRGLSPLTQLRVLRPSSSRPEVRAFVHHLKAHVDRTHLANLWRHAPDLFFLRLPAMSAALRASFASWLAGIPGDRGGDRG